MAIAQHLKIDFASGLYNQPVPDSFRNGDLTLGCHGSCHVFLSGKECWSYRITYRMFGAFASPRPSAYIQSAGNGYGDKWPS
jgi:hypothetical protein